VAFRVFLSYSLDAAEMALAWRLQTLAVAHGIEMYVPNYAADLTAPLSPKDSNAIRAAIDRADCVLAIITKAAGPAVQDELKYAAKKGKLVIPIVRSDLAGHHFLGAFPRVFVFSPWDYLGKTETEIVEFLKEQKVTRERQQTIGALAALGLGQLALFAVARD